jgi:hypothetical protein
MQRALYTVFALAFAITLGLSSVGCESSGSQRTTDEKTKPMSPEPRQGTITEPSNPM